MKNIDILFENHDIIIFNKPAGLAVQGGAKVGISLDSLLTENFKPRPLLVHRLDKDTSGIILVAKHKKSARRFSFLFSSGKKSGIIKQYLGVCMGSPPNDSGNIQLNLEINGKIKKSETAYKRLSGNHDFSLLELELGTGRMHQIRRHLSQIGNPILGDDKYGDFALNKKFRLKRLLLHASRLIISENASIKIDVEAPLPDYFIPFLAQGLN